jgi:hypothetical protein
MLKEVNEDSVNQAIESAVNAVRNGDQDSGEVVKSAPLPPVEQHTPVLDDMKASWGQIVVLLKDMSAYYGYDGDIPEHVLLALGNESGLPEALLQKKVLQKMHIHLLAKWGRGEIPGPLTSDNLEARAKRAEEAAKNMDKMKQPKAAEKQRQKAAALRATTPQPRHGKGWW